MGENSTTSVCQLWCIPSGLYEPSAVREVLSDDEWDKRSKFVRPVDRDLYSAAHVGVRLTLGCCLGVDPRELKFERTCASCGGPHGKPEIVGIGSGLHFSLSHSASLALVAISSEAVGVDVQHRDETIELSGLKQYSLTCDEIRLLDARPGSSARATFFDLWSCKEAVVKADGRGMSIDLDCVEFDPRDLDHRRGVTARSSVAELHGAQARLVDLQRSFTVQDDGSAALYESIGRYSAAVATLSGREIEVIPEPLPTFHSIR